MNNNWQLKFGSMKERCAHLFATGLRADCSFKMGESGKVFVAHKLILSIASPVFEGMFYGPVAEKSDTPIVIEGMDDDDFFDLLSFVYCDAVNITSMEKAQSLSLAGNRYMLDQLVKQCSIFIINNLNAYNVLSIWELAKRLNDDNLGEACLQIIRSQTSQVLLSPGILVANLDVLAWIVDQPLLSIQSELELFNAFDKYAKFYGYFMIDANQVDEWPTSAQNTLPKQDETAENRESEEVKDSKLNESNAGTQNKDLCLEKMKSINEMRTKFEDFQKIVKKIRFLTMSSTEFANGPAISRLLQPKDALDIFACIVNPQLSKMHYPNGFVSLSKKRILSL